VAGRPAGCTAATDPLPRAFVLQFEVNFVVDESPNAPRSRSPHRRSDRQSQRDVRNDRRRHRDQRRRLTATHTLVFSLTASPATAGEGSRSSRHSPGR
jgi:hypothetical protein